MRLIKGHSLRPIAIAMTVGMLLATRAYAYCSPVSPPVRLPDGRRATLREMMSAFKLVSAYKNDVAAYLACVKMEQDRGAVARARASKQMTLAIEQLHTITDQFNTQVHIFQSNTAHRSSQPRSLQAREETGERNALSTPRPASRYFQCKIQDNTAVGHHAEYYQTHDYEEGSSFRLDFVLFKQLGDDYVLSRNPDPAMLGIGPGKLAIHRADGRFEANFPVELDAQRNPVTLMHLTGVCNVETRSLEASSNPTRTKFNAKDKIFRGKATRLAQVPASQTQKGPGEALSVTAPQRAQTTHGVPNATLNLMSAAQSGDKTQLMLLLARGATADDLGYKQLAQFVTPGSEAILDALLTRGADPSSASADGQILIYAAVEARNPAAVAILLRHHATFESESADTDPLRLALLQGMTGVAIALTKAGANPDRIWNRDDKALGNAVDLAQVMLDVHYLAFLTTAPPRPDSATTQEVRVGLAAWGDGRARLGGSGRWNTALTRATKEFQSLTGLPRTGHPSLAMLSALGSKLDAIYLRAAKRGDVPELRRIQTAFPLVAKATDSAGFNALMLASYYGHSKAVSFLLASGAPINALSKNGSNAVLLAVLGRAHAAHSPASRRESDKILDHLVAASANVDARNADGVSAQSIADRNPELARALGVIGLKSPDSFYIAVLARPFGNAENSWQCSEEFPAAWLQAKFDHGDHIISLNRVADEWCLVTGDFILGNVSQGTREVTVDNLFTVAQEMKTHGETLTDFAASSDEAIAVFAGGNGDSSGWRTPDTDDLEDTIKTQVWGQHWDVERVKPAGDGRWLVIFGNTLGYGAQSYIKGSLQDVINGIHTAWQNGEVVTSFSHVGPTWFAVMSTGANEKDQSLLMATSFDKLSADIRAANQNGGWRVDLITGGTLASTGLLH